MTKPYLFAYFYSFIINLKISRTQKLRLHKWKLNDIINFKIKGLFDVIIGGNNMSENQVKITYKPLWKLLIDRDMTKTELRKKTQIAPSIARYFSKNMCWVEMRFWWYCGDRTIVIFKNEGAYANEQSNLMIERNL